MKTYKKYKESVVEWIGAIPEHWKCTSYLFLISLCFRGGKKI